jgi:hypothetical protein
MRRFTIIFVLLIIFFAPVFSQKTDKETVKTTQSEQTVQVAVKNKTLQIQNIKNGDKIQILNILGVKVLEQKSDSTSVSIELSLPQGYYIVKIGATVRKISLK